MRAVLRAPIALYRAGLGGLFGDRLLLLHHRGRKTGREYRTVLEVVDHDRETGAYYVAVGFGDSTNWYRNLLSQTRTRIDVAGRTLEVEAQPLGEERASALMVDYARRHPMAARAIARFMGFEVDGSQGDYAKLPSLGLQFVALLPVPTTPT